MTRVNSTTQQANFINSFCARELSATELRLFHIEEGRVRLRDRIADIFSKKNPEFDFQAKSKALHALCSNCSLTQDQSEIASKNFKTLYLLSIPKPSSGPIYSGY